MDHYEEIREGWCSCCLQPCEIVARDFGIGPYEYAGAPGCHTDWQEVSKCCEATVLEREPHRVDETEESMKNDALGKFIAESLKENDNVIEQ
jgi:hypothetical protein